MITDTCQTGQSLPIPVPRLIAFRFVTIEPSTNNSQTFEWLAFEGALSYIVQLSGSEGIVFREKVKHQPCDNFRQTYSYRESLLEPRQDYIFTVEIDDQDSNLHYCHTNNEPKIAQYVTQGIKNIKILDSTQFQVNILAQLDSLLMTRNELLNIIAGVIRQGSNSEIICFLNYLLAQGSAFELLAKASCSSDILNALSKIASQLAAANLTLSNYLQLSEIQRPLAESLALKSGILVFFAQNIQRDFFLNTVNINNTNSLTCNDCQEKCQYYKNYFDENQAQNLVCFIYRDCRNCDICSQRNS